MIKRCLLVAILPLCALASGQVPATPATLSSSATAVPTASHDARESPTPALRACTKTITFATAQGGQPVPAIPKFAAKWIGKAKHVEGYSDMCLSQIPSSRTANYVVIFATSDAVFDGLTPVAHTYTSSSPLSDSNMSVSSYGGTWSYSYSGTTPPGATSSIDLQRIDSSKKVLTVRAYDQQGRLVSHFSVDTDHNREKRLEQVLADIYKDVVERPTQKHLLAPLSVYYVNCDVDSPGPSSLAAAADLPAASSVTKSATPTATTLPLPPPIQATVDLSSDPAGADIYLDGVYIGKTPFTTVVAPGDHTVIVRKADFSAWGRKLQLVGGTRRVNAHLERKFLTLPPAGPSQPSGSN